MIYTYSPEGTFILNGTPYVFYFGAGTMPAAFIQGDSLAHDQPNFDYVYVYNPSEEDSKLMLDYYELWGKGHNARIMNECRQCLGTLEQRRQMFLDYVSSSANAFENNLCKFMYFTSSLGFKCDGDRRTASNLQGLIEYFDLQAKDGAIEYRDHDNITRQLTKEQLQTLLQEHTINGQMLYTQKWQMQQSISAVTTIDELSAAVNGGKLEFKMADFSSQG